MAKAKRMSDIFASSAEKSSSATTASATPYSSEGPTLPIIGGANGEHAVTLENEQSAEDSRKKRKTQEQGPERIVTDQTQPVPTFDPVLYEPWTLLPAELLKLLAPQQRLRSAQNIVSIVFTKNQHIKRGINRLKTCLGAYKDEKQPMDIPDALKETDAVIAVSAQGDGTAKLVSILDMVKRVVAPSAKEKTLDGRVEIWWMYTSLASVEIQKQTRIAQGVNNNDILHSKMSEHMADEDAEEEEEAFEPIEVDVPEQEQEQPQKRTIKSPVLTVWMTKKKIPAFKELFGEQAFEVQTLPHDDQAEI